MKKILNVMLVIVLCLVLSIKGVQAKSHINELFKAGDKITIDKKLDGTAFIAGNEIKVEETIDGIPFIAGNSIKINSEQDYLITAGKDIVLTNNINKDLFVAGENIEIKGSNLKRDAYIAGATVTVDGTVDRNIYIYGEKIELKGTYNGNITVSTNEISIDDDTIIKGTIKYNEDAVVKGLNTNVKTSTYKSIENEVTFKELVSNAISSYIHIALLGIVLVFAFEKIFKVLKKKTDKQTIKDVLINSGKGFLILVGTPIVVLMLLLTGLFVSVGVIGAIIYGIFIYMSSIVSGYVLANALDKKVFKRNMNNYLLVIVGLLILSIVKYIPVIGGLVMLISLLYGLGIIGNLILELKK